MGGTGAPDWRPKGSCSRAAALALRQLLAGPLAALRVGASRGRESGVRDRAPSLPQRKVLCGLLSFRRDRLLLRCCGLAGCGHLVLSPRRDTSLHHEQALFKRMVSPPGALEPYTQPAHTLKVQGAVGACTLFTSSDSNCWLPKLLPFLHFCLSLIAPPLLHDGGHLHQSTGLCPSGLFHEVCLCSSQEGDACFSLEPSRQMEVSGQWQ